MDENNDHRRRHRCRTIEVCQGLDCSASGGGAALIEIEELALESRRGIKALHDNDDDDDDDDDAEKVVVFAGGCRNLCTLGPNAHSSHDGRHFSRVRSPEDCEQLVRSSLLLSSESESESALLPYDGINADASRVAVLLTKTSNRKRWRVLRDVSSAYRRTNGKASARKFETVWSEDLREARDAELGAARVFKNSSERRQRAERRYERLLRIVKEKYVEVEDDTKT